MIVACLLYLNIHGHSEQYLVTGEVKASYSEFLNVDISNAVSGIEGAHGDYSNYVVSKDDCQAKEFKTRFRVRGENK